MEFLSGVVKQLKGYSSIAKVIDNYILDKFKYLQHTTACIYHLLLQYYQDYRLSFLFKKPLMHEHVHVRRPITYLSESKKNSNDVLAIIVDLCMKLHLTMVL